jgi:hypothetical protein
MDENKNHSIGFQKALHAANLAIRTDRIYLSLGWAQILSAMGAASVLYHAIGFVDGV